MINLLTVAIVIGVMLVVFVLALICSGPSGWNWARTSILPYSIVCTGLVILLGLNLFCSIPRTPTEITDIRPVSISGGTVLWVDEDSNNINEDKISNYDKFLSDTGESYLARQVYQFGIFYYDCKVLYLSEDDLGLIDTPVTESSFNPDSPYENFDLND